MTGTEIVVNVAGLTAITGIVWFFWLFKKKGARAAVTSGGVQEALIVVKGGYTPDTIVVERGRPVRLLFNRQETAQCSERVVLPAFDKSALLPTGETVAVEFLPREPGEYPFTC